MVFTYPHIGNVGINAGALAGSSLGFLSVPSAERRNARGGEGTEPACMPCCMAAAGLQWPGRATPCRGATLCPAAGDMESTQVHMGGVIVRDLSITVSNYRSNMTLDEYLKQQKVGAGCETMRWEVVGGWSAT